MSKYALDDEIRKVKKEANRDLEISQRRANPDYQHQRYDGEKRVEQMNHPRRYPWKFIND